MWPYVIEHPFKIGTYGVMMAVGFLTALWLLKRELKRRNLDVMFPPAAAGAMPPHARAAETIIFLGILGGVLGAKLAYMLTEAPTFVWKDLFSGSGLTWHGGLILAAVFIMGWMAWKRLPLLVMLDAIAPELATGYAFGRVGCQLAGDGDFGLPCVPENLDSFLCMSYPQGIVPSPCYAHGIEYQQCPTGLADAFWFPVHPTPIYEAFLMFLVFGVLWSIRKRIFHPGVLFGLYCVGAGLQRFFIEFIRQDEGRPDRFLDLRDAQIIALAQLALGVIIWVWAWRRSVPPSREYGVLSPEAALVTAKKRK